MMLRLLTLVAFAALSACVNTELGFEMNEGNRGVGVTPTFTTTLNGGGDN